MPPSHERGEEDLEGEGECVRLVSREDTCDQRTQGQAPDVRNRTHDPGATRGLTVPIGVEVGDECGGGGNGSADGDASQYAGHDQSGKGSPDQEHGTGDSRDRNRRQQHDSSAIPVGDVSQQQEARDDAHHIHRVDERDRERRKMFAMLVDAVQAARGGRERCDDEKRQRDGPEARSSRQPRNATD
jgi:hypothetical protein